MKDYKEYIIIDSGVRFGKPCIKGTRISVYDVLSCWLYSNSRMIDININSLDVYSVKSIADKQFILLINNDDKNVEINDCYVQ